MPELPEGFEPYDFHEFHRRVLPARLAAGHGALAAAAAGRLGPLAIGVSGGDSYTYVPRAGGIDVVPGADEARTAVELEPYFWQGLVHDLESAAGLLYTGRVTKRHGDLMRFIGWEPALRAMFHGRPPFDPETADLRDRNGAPLDCARTFRRDDADEDMAHFLRTAGFLLVKGVFEPDEVAHMLEASATLRAEAVEGDKESWWGKNERGETVLCRVTNAGRLPAFRGLYDDARIRRLAALSDHALTARAAGSEEGVSVLWKNPHMAEGLSDLPWHRDCGMGGHAVMCPILIFTLCLTDGSAEAGELRALPGSHRGTHPFMDARDPRAPRGVSLDAAAGDVSLHYGDVMHAAPPPTSAEGPHRVSALIAWIPAGARHHRGERAYNDALLGREDGQVEHLEDVIKRA